MRFRDASRSRAGEQALIAIVSAHGEPLVIPGRAQVERRLADTERFWRDWAAGRTYDGPWRDAVLRSALALKLLVFAPSGAIAAAATTSLPESIGGERNWDYRFSWVRDSAFTLDAFLKLGCPREATAFFWWLMHASQLTHPALQRALPTGWRLLCRRSRARPERIPRLTAGSGRQCGRRPAPARRLRRALSDLLALHPRRRELDGELGRRLARTADLVCELWRQPDSGIWEVRSETAPLHAVEDRLLDGARCVPSSSPRRDCCRRVRRTRWRVEAQAIRTFVEEHCWSEKQQSYVASPVARSSTRACCLPS